MGARGNSSNLARKWCARTRCMASSCAPGARCCCSPRPHQPTSGSAGSDGPELTFEKESSESWRYVDMPMPKERLSSSSGSSTARSATTHAGTAATTSTPLVRRGDFGQPSIRRRPSSHEGGGSPGGEGGPAALEEDPLEPGQKYNRQKAKSGVGADIAGDVGELHRYTQIGRTGDL